MSYRYLRPLKYKSPYIAEMQKLAEDTTRTPIKLYRGMRKKVAKKNLRHWWNKLNWARYLRPGDVINTGYLWNMRIKEIVPEFRSCYNNYNCKVGMRGSYINDFLINFEQPWTEDLTGCDPPMTVDEIIEVQLEHDNRDDGSFPTHPSQKFDPSLLDKDGIYHGYHTVHTFLPYYCQEGFTEMMQRSVDTGENIPFDPPLIFKHDWHINPKLYTREEAEKEVKEIEERRAARNE